MDTNGTYLTSLLKLGALYCDLEDALGKKIDLITMSSLAQPAQMPSDRDFRDIVWKEKKALRKYIQEQEKQEQIEDKVSAKEYENLFKGTAR